MKGLKFLVFVLLSVALLGGWLAWQKLNSKEGVILTFTEAQITERLDEKFPITEVIKEPFPLPLQVRVQTPEVSFIPNTDRLRARITVEMDAILAQYQASASFRCGIRYEASDQSLRLIDPVIEEIETTKIPEQYREPVHLLATLLAQKYLNDQPVYQLEKKDLQDHATRLLLKEVSLTDGLLVVRLGL